MLLLCVVVALLEFAQSKSNVVSTVIAFEDLAPTEQNKPQLYTADGALAWSTFNINNSYQVNDRFTVNLNLENLLDTHYRPYSSGISAPGFNAIISLRATF